MGCDWRTAAAVLVSDWSAADPDQDLPDAGGARLHPLSLPRDLGARAAGGGQPGGGLAGQVRRGEPVRRLLRVRCHRR